MSAHVSRRTPRSGSVVTANHEKSAETIVEIVAKVSVDSSCSNQNLFGYHRIKENTNNKSQNQHR